MKSIKIIETKFAPHGEEALSMDEWRHLKSYLALERGAMLLLMGERCKGLAQILISFWRKPRSQGAVRDFWIRGDDVPQNVLATYREIARNR